MFAIVSITIIICNTEAPHNRMFPWRTRRRCKSNHKTKKTIIKRQSVFGIRSYARTRGLGILRPFNQFSPTIQNCYLRNLLPSDKFANSWLNLNSSKSERACRLTHMNLHMLSRSTNCFLATLYTASNCQKAMSAPTTSWVPPNLITKTLQGLTWLDGIL